jgi:hypothetical protein
MPKREEGVADPPIRPPSLIDPRCEVNITELPDEIDISTYIEGR